VNRVVLAAIAAAAVALLVHAPASHAADECRGLPVCISVPGPWVAIPPPEGLAESATWKLACPRGVVGGVDARVSDIRVAVDFPGRIGSPVNPGITTAESLAVRGTYTGRARKATSYQPFIGCIPPSGGGARTRTSFSRTALKPGEPITLRVQTLRVEAGLLARTTLRCRPNERLLGSSHSVGFYTAGAPSAAELASVRVVQVRRGQQILVSATRRGVASGIRAEVQVQAECAR
jgi:hypothetical protein